jgi:hypothetical protein
MRLTGASRGFFLVPFWRVGGSPIVAVDKFNFIKGPLDTMGSEKIRVAVFGLNLMIPADVLRPEALSTLTRWFEDVVDPSPTRTDSL